ncbi:MAG: P-loop NTPase [Coriobacteriia bacterium]|nr:P-loop NTPase [Coriobacteriia bacterium]
MGFVAIADTSEQFVSGLASLLARYEGTEVRSGATVDGAVSAAGDPHVVVVGPTMDPESGFELVRRQSEPRRTTVVVVAREVSTDLMRRAMRAGVSDVLEASAAATDILEAVIAAYDTADETRSAGSSEPETSPGVSGRVITVFSMKGGVGKSVLATNLATALSSVLGKRTVIVDLDLQFGDVGIMLGLEPTRTIADAVHSIDRLDADLLEGYLVPHDSGLKALLAPVQPEDAETVTTSRVTRIIGLLREMYDYVVIDTAATFDEIVLTALDKSTDVYPVTMMDVASIKSTKISLDKLRQLGYANGLLHLVLNRADSKVWLQLTEVEKAVGQQVFAKIPSDRVIPRSVNKGMPVVIDEPKSDVAKVMVDIARGIVRSAEEVTTDVA